MPEAALANGYAGHVEEFGDGDRMAIAPLAAVTVPIYMLEPVI